MGFKTQDQLTAAADVQGGDLFMTWRAAGPSKKATATQLATFLATTSAMAGVFLQRSSNLSDLASAATARTNLGLGSVAVLTAGTAANNAVQLNGSAQLPAVDGSLLTNLKAGVPDVLVQHIGLGGASIALGAAIPLNTLARNYGSLASLASDTVTLPAGTYYFEFEALLATQSTAALQFVQVKLTNTSDATTVADGSAVHLGNASGDILAAASCGYGTFTIASSKNFKLISESYTTMLFGYGSSSVSGLNANLKIYKIS